MSGRTFTGLLCSAALGSLSFTALAEKPSQRESLKPSAPAQKSKITQSTGTMNDQVAPPQNRGAGETCASAVGLGGLPATVAGDTSDNTADTPDSILCGSGAGANSPTVWYSFLGDGTTITASLCGSGYDTTLHAYCGTCTAQVCVTGNDDFCGLQSQITFCTQAGQTYFLRIGGFGGGSGAYTMTVSSDGTPCGGPISCVPPPPLDNDTCDTARAIAIGGTDSATTVGANPDSPDAILCGSGAGAGSPTVWYTFVGDGTTITAGLCGSAYDTTLHGYCGECTGLFCVAGNDDFCGNGLQSQISFCTEAGRRYFLRIGGFAGQSGAYTLTLNSDGQACSNPPSCAPCVVNCCPLPGATGNNCSADLDGDCEIGLPDLALVLSAFGSVPGDPNYNAAADFSAPVGVGLEDLAIVLSQFGDVCHGAGGNVVRENEPDCGLPIDTVNGGCNSTPPVSISVACGDTICGTAAFDGFTRDTDWYDLTLATPQDVTITARAEFDVLIGFVGFPCPQTNFIAFNVGGPCQDTSLTFTLGAGTWYVFIAPQFTSTVACGADYRMTISCAEPPPGPANDICSGAFPIACGETIAGDNSTALSEGADQPASCAFGGPAVGDGTVWYSFQAADSNAVVSTCGGGSVPDTIVTVYSGTCGNLTEIACNDDSCGLLSEALASNLVTGQTYYIRVSSYPGAGRGSFTLSVNCFGDCTVAQPGDINEGEGPCFDDYVDNYDGGCNSAPPVFVNIACGDRVFGSGGNYLVGGVQQFRDTDWYLANFAVPTDIVYSGIADFPILLFIVTPNPDCSLVTLRGPYTAGACGTATSGTVNLPAGDHYFFAATQGFSGVACGSEYRLSLDCVRSGRCCLPAGFCAVLQPTDCANAGGVYGGDNTQCNVTPGGNTQTFNSNPNLPIPDSPNPGISDTINVGGAPFVVGKVVVSVDIPDHTYISDLHIRLTNGTTTIDLWDGQCGFENGLTVTFDDAGAPVLCAEPTTGTITPLQALSTFNGRSSVGAWTLSVSDEVGADFGTLVSWSLSLTDGTVTNCP